MSNISDELAQAVEEALSPEDRALVEEYIATQEAILHAADMGAISTYTPQAHQLPFHQSQASQRWFLGANKTGKTTACYAEVRWFALGEHPYRDTGKPKPGWIIWCCSPTEELSMMYTQPGVMKAIGQENIEVYRRGAHPMIKLKNGVTILFKYYAQGPKAFPAAGVRMIFFDEEPPWPVFEEAYFRRSSEHNLDIVGANTMVQGFTWIYDMVVMKKLKNTEWFTAKLRDNVFISNEQQEELEALAATNPTMHAIRVEGKILPIGGAARFSAEALAAMLEDIEEPRLRMDFDVANGRWVQGPLGRLSIYEMPLPGYEYVIGVDTAEGLNVSYTDIEPQWDETCLQIFNRTDKRFVADWTAGDTEPGVIGEHILPRLSDFYNGAKANVELNLHGFTVVTLARKYMASRLWSPTQDRAAKAQRPLRQFGTLLSDKNRTHLVDVLAEAVGFRRVDIPSGPTIHQFMSFVIKANGRVEHREGAKDDRVIACGHALVCDKDLPAPRYIKPPTIQDQLRRIAREQPAKQRRVQWFRKLAEAA